MQNGQTRSENIHLIGQLAALLHDLIMAVLKIKSYEILGANPCAYLIEQSIVYSTRQVARLLVPGELTTEYRLNGAGYKLYIRKVLVGNEDTLQVTIGGDQAKDYPNTS